AHDAWRHLRRVGHGLWSKPARWGYALLMVVGIGAAGVGVTMIATSTYAAYASDINNPQAILTKKSTGTTILDRNGKVLYQVYGASTRVPVEIDKTPELLVNATLAAEDPDFFKHAGISWRGMARALWTDITQHGVVEGGSTLTQQLVKNTLLTPDRTPLRKA